MKIRIVFTHKSTLRLDSIATYIYQQSQSSLITRNYLKKLRDFIKSTLSLFPKAGRPSDEIYPNTRKLVYQSYSIIYHFDEKNSIIYILTLYRENLP